MVTKIVRDDYTVNIEHACYKGSDVIVIGWVKGEAELSLMFNGELVAHEIQIVERPDVAAYFNIEQNQCFGFRLFSRSVMPEMQNSLLLRLNRVGDSTFDETVLEEEYDPTTLFKIVETYKGNGLPETFFEEGLTLDGKLYKQGEPADSRQAVGHIDVVKVSKSGREALVVGWAVARSPNDFILKVGGSFMTYDQLYTLPRPDIEELLSNIFGQNARTGGFIGLFKNLNLKNPDEPFELLYAKRSAGSLHLVASTERVEHGVPFEDMQFYLKGVHSPDISLAERVVRVDGPLAYAALTNVEDDVYFTRPDVVVPKPNEHPKTYVAVVVPKGFTGDVLQSIMAFVALKPEKHRMVLSFFFRDLVASSAILRDLADRAHVLFDVPVLVHNGCSQLSLGHISSAVSRSGAEHCFVVDARSGFEYQTLDAEAVLGQSFQLGDVSMFFSRDVNGISGPQVTFEMLNSLCSDKARARTADRPAFSKNKVFSMALSSASLSSLAQDMGFMKADELSDIELLIRRSDQLSAKYRVKNVENGLPFARLSQAHMPFQDSLGRQVEVYTMAQVGI
jgi:hypothetical protein